jgi:hypothetical protein
MIKMMKIYIRTFIAIALIVVAGNAYAQFSGGDGSSGTPWLISNATDLNNIRSTYLGDYFRQTANIDVSSITNWNPIGDDADGSRFTGNYDGNGFTISGLTINRPSEGEVGLFGCIGGGTAAEPVVIQDVELINVGDVSGARGTGSLVGRVRGNIYTLIENCSASGSGTVSGNGATGGLVGANNSAQETPGGTDNPTLSQSWANIAVLGVTGGGGDKIGGLVGCNQKGNTINCYARGSVTVPASGTFVRIGGLAGCTDLRGTITNSFSTGAVDISSNPNATLFGGLVGNLGSGGNAGVVTDSYWDTQTSGQSTSAAGTGYTTAQMKVQGNFTGFDFTNVWTIDGSGTINDGYPYLLATGVTTYNNWTGAQNTTWSNTNNWSASRVPIATDIAVIPSGLTNYPIITSSEDLIATAKLLDIAPGGSLTINALGKFEVIGDLRSETSGLTIKSDVTGTGSLLHDATNVNATIERYITGSTTLTSKSYHTVSIPLTQDAGPVSGLFLGSYLYEFDAINQEWDALGTPTNTPLSVDKGYLIFYPDASITYSFAGPMNNGVFDAPSMPTTAEDHHFIPNPYPSAIDWDASQGWNKTNLYDAVWIWSASAGNWAAYGTQTGGTNGASQYIPVGQGFLVQANTTGSPALSMNNNVRVHNDQAFLKNKADDSDILRVRSKTADYSDEILLTFKEYASNNFEGQFDVGKMYGLGDSPQLYSYSADNYKLSINAMEEIQEDITIQLGFEIATSGEVTLEFPTIETFEPETSVILMDQLTGANIDVRANSEYTFISQPEDDADRFKLQFKNATSIAEVNTHDLTAYFSGQTLYFNLDGFTGSSFVQLYNTSGQIVFASEVNASQNNIQIGDLSTGIYLVRLTNDQHVYSTKVSYR